MSLALQTKRKGEGSVYRTTCSTNVKKTAFFEAESARKAVNFLVFANNLLMH